MVGKRKLKTKIADEVKLLNTIPIESPFGDTTLTSVRDKKKKKKKIVREVIMFPEKQNSDSPKKSKLNKAPKEVTKMQSKLTNIIKVPKKQLDTFMEKYDSSSKDISSEFLATIAPAFLAFEDAMNYSTVALRDGLSYDGEIDLELSPLLEWSARLNTLELFLKTLTSLSTATKDRIVRYATIKAVDKAFNTRSNPMGNTVGNKVAGIVTTLANPDEKKIKKSLELVNKVQDAARLSKNSAKLSPNAGTIPGVLKKRAR